jgi:hypothetical protein
MAILPDITPAGQLHREDGQPPTDQPAGPRNEGWFNACNAPAGWTKIENEVLARAPEIGATAFLVYAVLKSHRNGSGDAWPSIGRIAALAGVSQRAVRTAIGTLKAATLIAVESRRDLRGGSLSHQYTFPLAPPHDPAEQNDTPGRNETPGGGGTKRHQGAAKNDMEGRNKALGEQEQEELEAKNKKTGKPVQIPRELDTPEFHAAWERWVAYRASLKPTCVPATLTAQLEALAPYGPEHAIRALQHAIRAGWKTPYPENSCENQTRSFPDHPRTRIHVRDHSKDDRHFRPRSPDSDGSAQQTPRTDDRTPNDEDHP